MTSIEKSQIEWLLSIIEDEKALFSSLLISSKLVSVERTVFEYVISTRDGVNSKFVFLVGAFLCILSAFSKTISRVVDRGARPLEQMPEICSYETPDLQDYVETSFIKFLICFYLIFILFKRLKLIFRKFYYKRLMWKTSQRTLSPKSGGGGGGGGFGRIVAFDATRHDTPNAPFRPNRGALNEWSRSSQRAATLPNLSA